MSSVGSERSVFSLNTARIQLDPTVWETPGAMPETAPSPDLGNRRLAVVPQLPPGHTSASGSNIRVGSGSVGAGISQAGNRLRVRVRFNRVSAALTLGAVLPPGAEVSSVELDGDQVRVKGHPGTNELVITLR